MHTWLKETSLLQEEQEESSKA